MSPEATEGEVGGSGDASLQVQRPPLASAYSAEAISPGHGGDETLGSSGLGLPGRAHLPVALIAKGTVEGLGREWSPPATGEMSPEATEGEIKDPGDASLRVRSPPLASAYPAEPISPGPGGEETRGPSRFASAHSCTQGAEGGGQHSDGA